MRRALSLRYARGSEVGRRDWRVRDYHRLHGAIGWQTPAERYERIPFTDLGFEHIPALEHLRGWLTWLRVSDWVVEPH